MDNNLDTNPTRRSSKVKLEGVAYGVPKFCLSTSVEPDARVHGQIRLTIVNKGGSGLVRYLKGSHTTGNLIQDFR